jgi:hypothetical protein
MSFNIQTNNKGRAVFTDAIIPANKLLFKFIGKPISQDKITNLNYVMSFDGVNYIEPNDLNVPDWHLINHSCEPNVEYRPDGVYSIKDIAAGEEIVSYYHDQNYNPKITCLCAKQTCVGSIGIYVYGGN